MPGASDIWKVRAALALVVLAFATLFAILVATSDDDRFGGGSAEAVDVLVVFCVFVAMIGFLTAVALGLRRLAPGRPRAVLRGPAAGGAEVIAVTTVLVVSVIFSVAATKRGLVTDWPCDSATLSPLALVTFVGGAAGLVDGVMKTARYRSLVLALYAGASAALLGAASYATVAATSLSGTVLCDWREGVTPRPVHTGSDPAIRQQLGPIPSLLARAVRRHALWAHYCPGSSSGRAWARSRISSIITDAIVMTFRHDLALSGASCSQALAGLVELEGEQPAVFVDSGEQHLVDGRGDGGFVVVGFCVWHEGLLLVSRPRGVASTAGAALSWHLDTMPGLSR
jgi:hypothetical protein